MGFYSETKRFTHNTDLGTIVMISETENVCLSKKKGPKESVAFFEEVED